MTKYTNPHKAAARETVRREMRSHLARLTDAQLVRLLQVWAEDLNPDYMKPTLDLIDDLADLIEELRSR
jgi:hypothetical protein